MMRRGTCFNGMLFSFVLLTCMNYDEVVDTIFSSFARQVKMAKSRQIPCAKVTQRRISHEFFR